MNVAEFAREGRRLSEKLDAAETLHSDHIEAAAVAERDYRKAKSEAWVRCPGGTAKQKEAWVDAQTADLRYKRDIAAGMVRHALQVQRNALAQMSLLQTTMNVERTGMDFARTAPEWTA